MPRRCGPHNMVLFAFAGLCPHISTEVFMKKFFTSLPFILLVAVVVGILGGLVANEAVMRTWFVTVKYVLGWVIMFCVPLIIIGFIAPSITKLGSNVSRILGVAVLIAYCSSIGARVVLDARRLRYHSQPVYRHVG